jgi:hypothetical protein
VSNNLRPYCQMGRRHFQVLEGGEFFWQNSCNAKVPIILTNLSIFQLWKCKIISLAPFLALVKRFQCFSGLLFIESFWVEVAIQMGLYMVDCKIYKEEYRLKKSSCHAFEVWQKYYIT